ncbi:hypothetical protein [Terasakiella sp.]|uniref:hypothetical protein n=1 Tax=Terasakiella sp. TaxID=2034861 RepID=UPI003AA9615B
MTQDLTLTIPHEIVEEELNAISRIWSAGKRLVTRGTLDNGTPFEIHVTITRDKEDFFDPDEKPLS